MSPTFAVDGPLNVGIGRAAGVAGGKAGFTQLGSTSQAPPEYRYPLLVSQVTEHFTVPKYIFEQEGYKPQDVS